MKLFKWYAIRVQGGQEVKIKENIERTFALYNMGESIEKIHAPHQFVYETKKRSKKKGKGVRKRHFSYLIIKTDLDDTRVRELLLSIHGVLGFLSYSGWGRAHKGVPLSDKEVDVMLGNATAHEQAMEKSMVEVDFHEGEEILVIEGAFKNMKAKIQRLDLSNKKVEVIIQVFKKATKVELAYSQIKKS